MLRLCGNSSSSIRLSSLTLSILLGLACSEDVPTGLAASPGRAFNLGVGGELQLLLQTIGPGEYAGPPHASSGALRYVGVRDVPPYVPAGPTQLFSFVGASPGTAIITFVSTAMGTSPTVVDTVNVQ